MPKVYKYKFETRERKEYFRQRFIRICEEHGHGEGLTDDEKVSVGRKIDKARWMSKPGVQEHWDEYHKKYWANMPYEQKKGYWTKANQKRSDANGRQDD